LHSLESSAENFVSILRDVVADYAATGSRLVTPS
jgi:hypothetical protein